MEISFTRVALLAAALFFVGCDQKPQPAKNHATEVTVLEGKTMGTFWRASIPGIDAKRSATRVKLISIRDYPHANGRKSTPKNCVCTLKTMKKGPAGPLFDINRD